MSHECPECGQECYCDGEDHHQDAPDDCCHACDEMDDGDDDHMMPERLPAPDRA